MNQSVQYLGIPATLHFLIILCNGVDDRSSVVVLSFHRKLHGVHIQYYIAFVLSIKYNLLVFVKKFNLKMYVLFS